MKKKLKSDSYVCICCSMFSEVQCPLKVVNLCSSRDVVVLDFYYNFGTYVVMILV
ncbi:hypothetical protein Hanom_Chr04g00335641 [Helianthus anomalus]